VSYQYRKIECDKKLAQIRKNERTRRQHASAIKSNSLIKDYEAACKALGRDTGRIWYLRGWYYIDRRRPVQATKLQELTKTLWAVAHEKELDAPVDNE
jgi:hypothetical protein